MAKRKSISKRVRFEVFKRDGFRCQYCGAHPPKAVLHVDHIIPVAENGTNDETNLVTSCDNCNFGKGARSLDEIPKSLESRAEDTKEKEEQILGYSKIMAARRQRIEDDCWIAVGPFVSQFGGDDRSIRRDWFQSVKRFVNELGVHEVFDAMEIAVDRFPRSESRAFKYFCGICWKKIKEA